MKKKSVKKLVLAKETVMNLGASGLSLVAGGFTNGGCSEEISASCEWSCACHSNEGVCHEPGTLTCI